MARLQTPISLSEIRETSKIFNFPIDPKENIRKKSSELGIDLPNIIIPDGNIHRFPTSDKKGDDAGWYFFHLNNGNFLAGKIGNYRSGSSHKVHSSMKELTKKQLKTIRDNIESSRKKMEADREIYVEQAIKKSTLEWGSFKPAPVEHPYLKAKGINGSYGLKINDAYELIIPRINRTGDIQSYQRVFPNKDESGSWPKKNKYGRPATDTYFIIGSHQDSNIIYIAEGIATAATIYEETGKACYVSFSSGNLPFTAIIAREQNKNKRIVIAADNGEVGEKWGKKAAENIGAEIVISPGTGGTDFNDYKMSGGNLKPLLSPISLKEKFKVKSSSDISDKFVPLDELIEDILVKGRTAMIYGDSNSGKTFFSLSLARDVSEGRFCYGKETQKGKVLYIAVEAPASIEMRIQAMNKYHDIKLKNIDILTRHVNFYEEEGVENEIIKLIEEDSEYNFIIVDTLAQSTAGANENSAEDMAPIMHKFEKIASETNTAVLIIHHSGKDKTKGARGSSYIYSHVFTEIHVTDEKGVKTALISKQKELGSKGLKIQYKLDVVELGLSCFKKPFSTCVAVPDNEDHKENEDENKNKKDKKLNDFIKIIEKAWVGTGSNINDIHKKPYITRSSLKTYLISAMGYAERSADNHLYPSNNNNLIGYLLVRSVIEKFGNGWIITDGGVVGSLMVVKNAQ